MPNKKYGFYMGKDKNEKKDFIFASIQTLGKKNQLERFKKDKRVKLSKNIDFTNNRKVRRKEYKISLEKKITSKLLIELANRRGAAQEQSK